VARQAASDPDPRVQANAVEALERMNDASRVPVTLPKLESEHHRVRANAVKSLLPLELAQAADALLAMLEDKSPAHRLSGIWVVEQLSLRSLIPILQALSESDPSAAVRRKSAGVVRQLSTGHRGQARASTAPHPQNGGVS
jgi:HEAT repeat protein